MLECMNALRLLPWHDYLHFICYRFTSFNIQWLSKNGILSSTLYSFGERARKNSMLAGQNLRALFYSFSQSIGALILIRISYQHTDLWIPFSHNKAHFCWEGTNGPPQLRKRKPLFPLHFLILDTLRTKLSWSYGMNQRFLLTSKVVPWTWRKSPFSCVDGFTNPLKSTIFHLWGSSNN